MTQLKRNCISDISTSAGCLILSITLLAAYPLFGIIGVLFFTTKIVGAAAVMND